ncbi:MAG TPA: NUDIX domain-containing protein [Streptosporangiaceae bacterium]|nr:NUDIX domain-containing protein [Streptosporangiaceae bacterium]
MTDRYRSIIDAHILLRRAGEILLAQRAGDVYASGQYGLPSGHLEQGESILDAVIRETEEEVGIVLEPAALRMVLVMHQRNPGGHARIGFFFEPLRWDGEPVNREPAKCSGLLWADPDNLPAQTVPYTAAAISRIQEGATFALNGWDQPASYRTGTAAGSWPP